MLQKYKSQDNNASVTQVASNVGSLKGNVNLSADVAFTMMLPALTRKKRRVDHA